MNDKKQLKITLTMLLMGLTIVIMIILLLIMVILNKEKQGTIEKLNENAIGLEETISNLQNKKVETQNTVSGEEVEEKEESKEDNTDSKWVSYPPTITKQAQESLGIEVEGESTAFRLMEKTVYSLSKKYSNPEDNKFIELFNNKLGIGDSTKIIDNDINYSRYVYPDNEDNNLSAKYEDKIEYKIAVFNEAYYDGYYSIEECTKRQYDKLVVEKDYGQYENVPENLYFSIGQLLVMNGNNESKNDFENYSRAKKLKVTINGEMEYEIPLEDTNEVQVFDIGYKQETIEHPVNIEVEVLEQYNGKESKDVYISDIQFSADSNIPQGR